MSENASRMPQSCGRTSDSYCESLSISYWWYSLLFLKMKGTFPLTTTAFYLILSFPIINKGNYLSHIFANKGKTFVFTRNSPCTKPLGPFFLVLLLLLLLSIFSHQYIIAHYGHDGQKDQNRCSRPRDVYCIFNSMHSPFL